MNFDTKAYEITLDWDNITWREFYSRITWIINVYGTNGITALYWRMSATKGFHVRVIFKDRVNVAQWRKHLKDDGRRIVGDLMRESEHDILWNRKHYGPMTFDAGRWIKAWQLVIPVIPLIAGCVIRTLK